ncbi:MAG: hypothetical protein PVH36_11540 [Desulfobacterales bacterium]
MIEKDDIWPAHNIQELGVVCYNSEPFENEENIKVIDSSGEEFWYSPDQIVLMPGFFPKKWTKKQLIELFDNSETAKENKIRYTKKSLSNIRVATIVSDICAILSHNMSLNADG